MAMDHTVTLLMSQFVTHDVKRFIVSKPEGLSVDPGQGVELAIDLPGLREQGRPFTPTGLVVDRVLEFTIKAYPAHAGVTQALH
jgi:ferredoxin-NADP reductase